MCDKCGYEHNKDGVLKVWKEHGYGRLYWRSKNPRMYWDRREAIAQVKIGAARVFYDHCKTIIHDVLNIDDDY